jgi:hypothetical protein
MAVRVKVNKDKLVQALENKLVEDEFNTKQIKEDKEAFEKESLKVKKSIAEKIVKELTLKSLNVYTYRDTVELSFELPKNFKVDEVPEFKTELKTISSWEKKEIENAIRILKLSDEETVNTSTYKDVAQYL